MANDDERWPSNDEQWQAGLSVIAAPIFADERMLGCVALAMVAARFHEISDKAALRHVVHAAEGIALRLERHKA